MFLEEIKFHIDATLKIVEKKILQSVLIHISYQTNSTQFVFPQIQSIWMGLKKYKNCFSFVGIYPRERPTRQF